MSLIRWSFFKEANNTLAFSAQGTNMSSFINYMAEKCALNLTEIEEACSDPDPIAWGGINACDGRSSWLKEFTLATCDQLSQFPEQMLDCLENTAREYLNSQDQKCPLSWSWFVAGGITLAVIAGTMTAYCIYIRKQAVNAENEALMSSHRLG